MNRFLIVIVLLSMSCPLCRANTNQATRVALVSSPGDTVQKVVALAEAELSAQDGLELLERGEINRILSEHKLSVAGFVDAETAVRAGKLLAVDLFAVVSAGTEAKEVLALTIFDAATGIRYWDVAISPDHLDKAVQEVVSGVRGANAKRNAVTDGGKVVCMLSARNADLPRQQDRFCQTVAYLLERELVHAPSISVVERSRLDQINKERSLPGAGRLKELVASAVMLELEIGQSEEPDQVRATVYLTGYGGETIGKVAVTGADDAPELADALLGQVCQALESTPPSTLPDRKLEAKRFRLDAEFSAAHDRLLLAWRAAEAALALDPDDDTYWGTAAEHMMSYAGRVLHNRREPASQKDFVASLDAVENALILTRAFNQKKGGVLKVDYTIQGYLGSLQYSKHHTSDTRRRASAMKQSYLDMWGFRSGRWEDPTLLYKFDDIWNVGFWIRMLERCSESSEQYIQLTSSAMDLWLKRAEEAKHNRGMVNMFISFRDFWEARNFSTRALVQKDEVYFRGMQAMCAKLEGHSDPLIRLSGKIVAIPVAQQAGSLKRNEVEAKIKEVHEFAKTVIANPGTSTPNVTRALAYYAIMDAHKLVDNIEKQALLDQELFEFMLSRNELFFPLCKSVTEPVANLPKSHYPRMVKNGDRIIHALNAGARKEAIYAGDWQRHSAKFFADRREAVLAKFDPNQIRSPRPWRSVRKLMDKQDLPDIGLLCHPIVDGNQVYLVGIDGDYRTANTFEILRCDLTGGPVSRFGRTHTGDIPGKDKTSNYWYHNEIFPSAVLADDQLFISTAGQGIFIVPLDGSPVQRVSMEEGLPSNSIHELAIVGRDLYFGCGVQGKAAYFVKYSLDDQRTEIIASSQRKEKRTTLDNTNIPFYIQAIRHDVKRGRLVLLVDCGRKYNDFELFNPVIGLHEYELDAGRMKQLAHYEWTSHWAGRLQDRRFTVSPSGGSPRRPWHMWFGASEYDLSNDTSGILYSFHKYPPGPSRGWAGKKLLWKERVKPPYLLHNGWLYFHFEHFGRVSLRDGTTQLFPELGLQRIRWVVPSQMHFEWIEEKQSMLVSDDTAIWILENFEVDEQYEPLEADVQPGPSDFFRRMDSNADGQVTREEYVGLFVAHFSEQDRDGSGTLSEAEFSHPAFKNMDTDGDGQATLTEFKAMRNQHFDQLDNDQSGRLTADEL